ncbi:unnamed protein product [Spirodela intermedia]|uniref:Sulfhydryl oxidase n=1 Tax=Spirodela intermedia TaxID=51605 RepID=A0A7I8JMS2_SPIIN|nr:unnamed protein product [Spirodela intermedia]CAA6671400.1 unnamed protein product [Spirodela intermedia]
MSPLYVGLVALVLLVFARFDGASGDASSSWERDAGPRRALLRDLVGGGGELPDAALELNTSTFDAVLGRSPARFAVVEFFASWCPACRNYKPHYEKVARIFNGANAVHPGIVVMTRVDCAQKMNVKLCDRFSVSHYPTLLWGPPSKFISGKWSPEKEDSGIQAIDNGRTAEILLNWINERLGRQALKPSSFGLQDEKFDNENTLLHNPSDPEQIARAIYDVEEATVEAFNIILHHKMIKPKTHAPLIKFFQLIVAHHPSKSAEVLVNFDDLWSLNSSSASSKDIDIPNENSAITNFHICGKEVPRGYWIFCRGSKMKPGISGDCGLWILLHSLSVRVRDEESSLAFTTICEFIHSFFACEECRRHFYKMCSSVAAPPNTTRELALWLWSSHNRVNERLLKTERESQTGDPKFPKMAWPPSQLCPSCYRSSPAKEAGVSGGGGSGGASFRVDWSEDDVFSFLARYYGATLASSYKDDDQINRGGGGGDSAGGDEVASTGAMAVPLGAALGIALASCAFGALACFWRTQQKKRKYFRQLHSLKNI